MPARTKSGEILTQIILETFRLNGELLEAGNWITQPYGLTSARWQVMGAIDSHAAPMTVSKIARLRGLNRQGVQRIVNDLEELGMVVLTENPDHKRAKLVSLSKKGAKIMIKINDAQALWVNELSSQLGNEKMNQALALLRLIRNRSENSRPVPQK